MKLYRFQLEFDVRDYECDMNGHVNNSVYLNYLEHARHEYLKSLGLPFAEFVRRGYNLIIIRSEIDYKRSLESGDRFKVCLNLEKVSPLRYRFEQDIYSLPDEKVILKARVIGTALNIKGRPELPPEIRSVVDRDEA